MKDIKEPDQMVHELEDEDRELITDRFFEEMVPKLRELDARTGTLNCEFAGKGYGNWNIRFRSAGSGFDIMEIFYDEDGAGMDLDL